MKISFCLVALCATTVSALAPLHVSKSTTTKKSSSLNVSPTADMFGKNNNKNDWEGKPTYEQVSTTPVADVKVTPSQRARMADVILPPDYTLTWAIAALGPLIWWYHPSYMLDGSPSLIGIFGGGFHVLFATLLYVQTARVRCVMEKDSFEFYHVKGPKLDLNKGAKLCKKPGNYVTTTQNRWRYDAITNYGFFPSEDFPVIIYFKETDTDKSRWNKWFAAFDSYGRGQPHFFPGICDVHKFKAEMEKRGVKRKPIPNFLDMKDASKK